MLECTFQAGQGLSNPRIQVPDQTRGVFEVRSIDQAAFQRTRHHRCPPQVSCSDVACVTTAFSRSRSGRLLAEGKDLDAILAELQASEASTKAPPVKTRSEPAEVPQSVQQSSNVQSSTATQSNDTQSGFFGLAGTLPCVPERLLMPTMTSFSQRLSPPQARWERSSWARPPPLPSPRPRPLTRRSRVRSRPAEPLPPVDRITARDLTAARLLCCPPSERGCRRH